MFKQIIKILIVTLFSQSVFAQNKFNLKCKNNIIKNGYAILAPSYSNKILYDFAIKNDSVKISNYKFSFSGKISYPQTFYIKIIDTNSKSYYLEDFFIDQSEINLEIDSSIKAHNVFSVFSQGVKVNKSLSNDEYFKEYLPSFISLNKKIDTIFNLYSSKSSSNDTIKLNFIKERDSCRNIRDTLLYRYSLKNKHSSILPWMLYQHIEKYGYKYIYQRTFDNMVWSNSRFKRNMQYYLNQSKNISINKIIPEKNKIIKSLKNKDHAKYILIDFWFSSCQPCLKQFEDFRSIYSKFHPLGFEIIAISVDEKSQLKKYKSILENKNYPWVQILDINKSISSNFKLNKFPYNILLNKEGKVLKIDIEPIELNEYLNNELLK